MSDYTFYWAFTLFTSNLILGCSFTLIIPLIWKKVIKVKYKTNIIPNSSLLFFIIIVGIGISFFFDTTRSFVHESEVILKVILSVLTLLYIYHILWIHKYDKVVLHTMELSPKELSKIIKVRNASVQKVRKIYQDEREND